MSSSVAPRSSTTSSASPKKSDIFKPNLPLDPFIEVQTPWIIGQETLATAAGTRLKPSVLLILGEPSIQDLAPLIHSRHLSTSLLIIAAHRPPKLPLSTIPAVRILRISATLSVENAGAVRYVALLGRAERVARTWRARGGNGVVELGEHEDGRQGPALDDISDLDALSFSSYRRSFVPRARSPSPANNRQSLYNPFSKLLRGSTVDTLPPRDPSQRPFDAIFNYLPQQAAEKALLKQAILITTISAPFLYASSPLAAEKPKPGRRSKKSTTSTGYLQSDTSFEAEGFTAEALDSGKSHIVHILPAFPPSPQSRRPYGSSEKPKLAHSLESFLLSFSFPIPSNKLSKEESYHIFADVEKARPYLVASDVAGEHIGGNGIPSMSIVDLILAGVLDDAHPPPFPNTAKGKSRSHTIPRAWISEVKDIIISGLMSTAAKPRSYPPRSHSVPSITTTMPSPMPSPMLPTEALLVPPISPSHSPLKERTSNKSDWNLPPSPIRSPSPPPFYNQQLGQSSSVSANLSSETHSIDTQTPLSPEDSWLLTPATSRGPSPQDKLSPISTPPHSRETSSTTPSSSLIVETGPPPPRPTRSWLRPDPMPVDDPESGEPSIRLLPRGRTKIARQDGLPLAPPNSSEVSKVNIGPPLPSQASSRRVLTVTPESEKTPNFLNRRPQSARRPSAAEESNENLRVPQPRPRLNSLPSSNRSSRASGVSDQEGSFQNASDAVTKPKWKKRFWKTRKD